ncbi:MAG: glycosyltransferase family 9 protein [Rhodospirillales bacterium]|nr:glycosyltransferase family 9 protein [Rhodospirillales bacterium]
MRILFITATRVGDAVLSTGLLHYLLQRHPEARVTVACGPAAAGLFEAVPGLERIITLEKKQFSLHWLRLWALSVGCVWDVVVDLRNAPLSYAIPSRKAWHLGRKNMSDHRVVRIAGALGLQDSPPSPHLWTSDEHQKRARNILAGDGPVLAIGPVANWRPKTWAADRFVELAARLTAIGGILPDARVAVFGTHDERDQAGALIDALPHETTLDLMGKLDLLEIQACFEQVDMFIGNDSGLMHMAAAAGVPTLGLFGPSREEHYAPWGNVAMAVRGDLGYHEVFPKGYDYRNADGHDLMSSLTVDRVYEAVVALWHQAKSGQSCE